ncbi:hypothetical protein CDAR_424401 [Caerostris darwini]|uniref:Uncharacterized protein n=1 Tax=Caerostris darwini TaxID=1538125 RepID=A0AAV4T238_9ARAC|nr:hypothetical protein CDAR_424401 [Caerostris darwini]
MCIISLCEFEVINNDQPNETGVVCGAFLFEEVETCVLANKISECDESLCQQNSVVGCEPALQKGHWFNSYSECMHSNIVSFHFFFYGEDERFMVRCPKGSLFCMVTLIFCKDLMKGFRLDVLE